MVWLHNSNEASLVSFERADNKNEFVVIINFSNRPIKADVETSGSNDFAPMQIDGMPRVPEHDFPSVHLGAYDWRVYHRASPPIEAAAGTSETQIGSAH